MRYRRLCDGGPEVSVVCFGTWAAGGMWGSTEDAEVVAAMRSALDEHGINFFDTADAYGWGRSEELIAEAFEGRRDEVVIATKVGITPGELNLDPGYIREACEASLRRLRTDVIDLYQIHWPVDPKTPLDKSWEAMAGLAAEGKVRRIGVSNFGRRHLETVSPVAPVGSVQNQYSMLVRDPERGVLDWCRKHGTGFLSYGSLAYGILTGKFAADAKFERTDWRSGRLGIDYYEHLFAPDVFARHLATVERLKRIATGAGITPAQLAVAWILRDEAVASAIAGAKRPAQIADTAAAGDVVLDAETLRRIEDALAA